jgi:hypothetical protein
VLDGGVFLLELLPAAVEVTLLDDLFKPLPLFSFEPLVVELDELLACVLDDLFALFRLVSTSFWPLESLFK